MPSLPDSTPPSPPSPLDLDAYSEATRRALYDIAVSVFFTGPQDPDLHQPPQTPEDAGLVVFWIFDRWFCVFQPWLAPEEGFLPPWARWIVSRITASPEALYGVTFHEC
jgi:hypothetical protein